MRPETLNMMIMEVSTLTHSLGVGPISGCRGRRHEAAGCLGCARLDVGFLRGGEASDASLAALNGKCLVTMRDKISFSLCLVG